MTKHIFYKNNMVKGKPVGKMGVCLSPGDPGDTFTKNEADADCEDCLSHRARSKLDRAVSALHKELHPMAQAHMRTQMPAIQQGVEQNGKHPFKVPSRNGYQDYIVSRQNSGRHKLFGVQNGNLLAGKSGGYNTLHDAVNHAYTGEVFNPQ